MKMVRKVGGEMLKMIDEGDDGYMCVRVAAI